jgi:uncharacterized protein GlcG (DUF336 family)
MTLTMDQALTIARAAIDEGKKSALAPLSVAILDRGGHALAMLRDERASNARHEIAMAKAGGCLALGLGGREIVKRSLAFPAFFSALNSIVSTGILPARGGVLVRSASGVLLGAVGVSGDTSDNDERCAMIGIAAVGLVPDTGE